MKCKITRNAAKKLKEVLEHAEDKELKIRAYVDHVHGDHAHYSLKLDLPTEKDIVLETDKGIDLILETGVELLDGLIIDYLYIPEERFILTNPSKGNYGEH